MFSSAFTFLLNIIFSILTMIFLLRFIMQLVKTPFHNPIGQMVMALSDFAVKPVRKFIPSWKKIDLSTLLLAFVAQLMLQVILLSIRGFPFTVAGSVIWPSIFGLSMIGVIRTIIDIFFYALILQVILSWVNPHTPIAPVVNSLTRPILAPIQQYVPTVSGIDFSPMIAIILLQMINVSVIATLAASFSTVF